MSEPRLGVREFFQKFDKDHLSLVDEFYDPHVHFVDPMVNFSDRAQLKAYYERLYKNVESIRFDFSSETRDGDTRMAAWTMTVVAKNFNGGRPVVVDGVSHIRFGGAEGKAVYHRDYFDMGVFVYEHVPVLSSMIRFVKKIMSGQHQ